MGIKHQDLFLPVLTAFLIHGIIALIPVPEKSIQHRAFQVSRPPAVRFMTIHKESMEKMPPAYDLTQIWTDEKQSPERKTGLEMQTYTPSISEKHVKKNINLTYDDLKNERQKNDAISEKRIERKTNTDIKIQSGHIRKDAELNFDKEIVAMPSSPQNYANTKKEKVPEQVIPRYRENPPPAYPQIARRRGYEGVVMLFVEVRSDGTVENITIKESSGKNILDNAAVEGVRTWTFYPALREGKPVSAQIEVPVRFVLR